MSAARPFKRQRFTEAEPSRKAVRVFAEDPTSIVAQATEEEEEETDLQLAQQSFHSIYLEGCEALISSTADGRLDLRDVYIKDEEVDIFAEPHHIGEMPMEPHHYAEVEWASEDTGDTLMGREGSRKVLKVYLIKVEQQEPFRLDLTQVFSVDHATKEICRETILGLAKETDVTRHTLSITREGIFLEDNSRIVSEDEVVEAWWTEQEEQRVARLVQAKSNEFKGKGQEGGSEDQDIPRDPIDALNDDDREYDESQEDTPSVDQGY